MYIFTCIFLQYIYMHRNKNFQETFVDLDSLFCSVTRTRVTKITTRKFKRSKILVYWHIFPLVFNTNKVYQYRIVSQGDLIPCELS